MTRFANKIYLVYTLRVLHAKVILWFMSWRRQSKREEEETQQWTARESEWNKWQKVIPSVSCMLAWQPFGDKRNRILSNNGFRKDSSTFLDSIGKCRKGRGSLWEHVKWVLVFRLSTLCVFQEVQASPDVEKCSTMGIFALIQLSIVPVDVNPVWLQTQSIFKRFWRSASIRHLRADMGIKIILHDALQSLFPALEIAKQSSTSAFHENLLKNRCERVFPFTVHTYP